MSIQKKKLNDMNIKVIQTIISSQINGKKPLIYTKSPTHVNINIYDTTPTLMPLSTPKNPFYLPTKPLDTEIKKVHPSNKSLDLHFRIKSKNGIDLKNVERKMTNDEPMSSQVVKTDFDLPNSKRAYRMTIANKTTGSFFPVRERKELKIEVMLPDEKIISFTIDDLEGKTIKVLKNKILNEIRSHLEEEKFIGILSFRSTNKLYLLDCMMDLDSHSLSFMEDKKDLIFTPIYKELCAQRRSLRDYEIITLLGSGGFSKVVLGRSKMDGKLYALKILDRAFIRKNKKEGIIMNEKNIMANTDHPFLVKMFASFKTKRFLVFVMEWCPGGELFFYLKKHKRMSEDKARFFFIELCLGVQYLHQKNIIYRDLKPENLLFDIYGHLKIADFGLAKPNIDEDHLAYSFCGSPEYMSPEMLAREGHDRLVDIYGLGLMLYEMVVGIPPFYSPNFDDIFNSVLTENVSFPTKVPLSHEIKTLISRILMKRPEDRLGFMNGVRDILNHPWCKKINYEDILEKKLKSPFQPDYFQIYFEATKEIEEIRFLKDLQFEKNDEVLNEIYDSEENDKGLIGFAFDNKPQKFLVKKTFGTKTQFTVKTNEMSTGNALTYNQNKYKQQAKNNYSTGHLMELKSAEIPNSFTSFQQLSPMILFPTHQTQVPPSMKIKTKLFQEIKQKNITGSNGYAINHAIKMENSIMPIKKMSENLYNFSTLKKNFNDFYFVYELDKESILQKKNNEIKIISKKKLTG